MINMWRKQRKPTQTIILIGRVLNYLLEGVIAGDIDNTYGALLKCAREIIEKEVTKRIFTFQIPILVIRTSSDMTIARLVRQMKWTRLLLTGGMM